MFFTIHELLGIGQENAITAAKLAEALGTNVRQVQAAVRRERLEGVPICATKSCPPGLFIATGPMELERYRCSLDSELRNLRKTREAVTDMLDAMTRQVRL